MSLAGERRVGSRLGKAVATLIEQVPGQHGKQVDGDSHVIEQCAWVPLPPGTETQGNRATTELLSTLYVPQTLPDVADWVCTVEPGPTNPDGTPKRLAVAGPAAPYWRRKGTFSHSQVTLRSTTS